MGLYLDSFGVKYCIEDFLLSRDFCSSDDFDGWFFLHRNDKNDVEISNEYRSYTVRIGNSEYKGHSFECLCDEVEENLGRDNSLFEIVFKCHELCNRYKMKETFRHWVMESKDGVFQKKFKHGVFKVQAGCNFFVKYEVNEDGWNPMKSRIVSADCLYDCLVILYAEMKNLPRIDYDNHRYFGEPLDWLNEVIVSMKEEM